MCCEVGTFYPTNPFQPGKYIGPGTGLRGCTGLISDEGEYWSVQVSYHPQGLMMYGWWKCLKTDWEVISDPFEILI